MRIFIIILTLVMTFKPVLPLVDYVVNYDYISEVLCINKDKPELQCNGKCHLKTKLAKASDESSSQDTDTQQSTKRLLQVEFLENHHLDISLQLNDLHDPLMNTLFNQTYNYQYSSSIFHPPLA